MESLWIKNSIHVSACVDLSPKARVSVIVGTNTQGMLEKFITEKFQNMK